jgi:hypothetical protein
MASLPTTHFMYQKTLDKVTLCPEEIRKLTELSQVNVDGTKLIYKYGKDWFYLFC